MDEIDRHKLEQYMLQNEIPNVDFLIRMNTVAMKALRNIFGELDTVEKADILRGGYEWDES